MFIAIRIRRSGTWSTQDRTIRIPQKQLNINVLPLCANSCGEPYFESPKGVTNSPRYSSLGSRKSAPNGPGASTNSATTTPPFGYETPKQQQAPPCYGGTHVGNYGIFGPSKNKAMNLYVPDVIVNSALKSEVCQPQPPNLVSNTPNLVSVSLTCNLCPVELIYR
jgi:hypothetical protein